MNSKLLSLPGQRCAAAAHAKLYWRWLLVALMVASSPACAFADSLTLAIPPGFSHIANPLDHGGNTLNEIFPGMPVEAGFYKWDCSVQDFVAVATFDGAEWIDINTGEPSHVTLLPGEGAMIFNPEASSFQVAFTGTPHVPVLPPPQACGCGQTNFFSLQAAGLGTFDNITGEPPREGSQVWRFANNNYTAITFTGGAWDSAEPILNLGEAALFYTPCPINCCDGCAPDGNGQYPASYTVTVHPGFNYLANQLCHGANNTLAEVLPPGTVPAETKVQKWSKATQSVSQTFSSDGTEWLDNDTGDPGTTSLPPGEGFILYNPGAEYQLTFQGCEPSCPPPCAPTNTVCLVGRIGSGAPTYYSNLFTCPILCGTRVTLWNPTNQVYFDYNYANGVWTPSEPVLGAGQSALVSVVENPSCLPCTNNLVINGSFETPPVAGTFAFFPNGSVPGWNGYDGACGSATPAPVELWGLGTSIPPVDGSQQLEISANVQNETVCQTLTNLTPGCPATFCFLYTGRPGIDFYTGHSYDNRFTVTLSGGYTLSVPLNPLAYNSNNPAAGWQEFCTNFVPSTSTVTISFSRQPSTGDEGGAHIDKVSVTQCCPTNPCSAPLILICASNKTVECSLEWAFDPPSVTSECCGSNVVISVVSTVTNSTSCPFVVTRNWAATDCNNNTLSCSQTVTVVDTTPPVLRCASDKTAECGSGWTFDLPEAFDACCLADATISIVSTVTNGTCPTVITRTWQATDCCTNRSTCSQTVTVVDTTPPVFACVSPVNLVLNGSFENGSPAFNPADPLQGLGQGSTQVAGWTVVETGSAAFYWVNGNHPAFAATTYGPASDGNLYMYFNGSYDNSSTRSKIASSVTFPSAGTYRLEYDMWSESSINGARDAGFTVELGVASYTDRFTPPYSPNDSYPSITAPNWQHIIHDFTVPAGTQVLSFTDASVYGDPNLPNAGNTPSPLLDNVSITSLDNCCATNKTVNCGLPWSFDTPTVTDTCSGTNVSLTVFSTVTNGLCPQVITRRWLATDECGNSSTCSQTVTLVDTTPPQIFCPTNIVLISATNVEVCYAVTATDNCDGNVTVVCTPPSCSVFVPGTTNTVNCVATDACGNSNSCSFTVIVKQGRTDLWITDTPYNYTGATPDQGDEPDAGMIPEQMWMSSGIWIHQDCVQPPGNYLTHQNPRYGQQNCVFAEVRNRGSLPIAGAKVELWYANAGLGLTWPAQWTLIGTVTLPNPINPGGSAIAQAPWFPAGTGHYCILARISPASEPMTHPETSSIWTNVRLNNNLGWRNVNVTDCLRTPGDKVEVRVRNFEPAPKLLTLVFTADEDFLTTGGVAILSPGSALFQRWKDAGGKGTNFEVINGNEIRFTGSPATFENIPFGENEERIFNLTLRADQPMPVPGTSHTYHAHLMQKIDEETVGGVAYTIVTRAADTDTDGDGVPDVTDPDDDNDGIIDTEDLHPIGEPDCLPAALTINRTGQEVTITWSGLNYHLQSVHNFGDEWEDVAGASSPYVRATDGDHRFFRLICR